jgi:hypothetical protein
MALAELLFGKYGTSPVKSSIVRAWLDPLRANGSMNISLMSKQYEYSEVLQILQKANIVYVKDGTGLALSS